ASSLEEVPISLSFELGRRKVPLGELETLKEGFVFELDREAKRPVLILPNGRVIGTGELVKVGERVGVRVAELGVDPVQ
ncbi:MAG: FliM/FliN family flagellar motor switch protein, partial [Methylacidiphilaceae bacterium]|nr:FliM/FliN family flagellar motor switch protein [Candidatus Methylacidiphilaceae bacterium]